MQDGTASGTLERSNDGDDIYQAVVADLASLIARVQASLAMIETAVAGEAAATLQDLISNVVVLDDFTPRYLKAGAALKACDTGLGIALHFHREPTTSGLGLRDSAWNHYPTAH